MRRGRRHWVAVVGAVVLYAWLLSPLDPLTARHVVAHQTLIVLVAVPLLLGMTLGRDVAIWLPIVFPLLSLFPEACTVQTTAFASTSVCNDYSLLPAGAV